MSDVDSLSHSDSEEEPIISKRKKRAGSDAEEDYAPSKGKGVKGGKGKKRGKPAAAEEEVSDEDWGKRKKQAKKAPVPPPATGGGRGKQSAFTKAFKLSPELADVVGSDVMPRHEVVKRLWMVIKERELQDPKNKQFAICDDQLLKVFGVKRFRTFGMMKHLKGHFLEAA